eukprot:1348019-Amphidinium_carterae.1
MSFESHSHCRLAATSRRLGLTLCGHNTHFVKTCKRNTSSRFVTPGYDVKHEYHCDHERNPDYTLMPVMGGVGQPVQSLTLMAHITTIAVRRVWRVHPQHPFCALRYDVAAVFGPASSVLAPHLFPSSWCLEWISPWVARRIMLHQGVLGFAGGCLARVAEFDGSLQHLLALPAFMASVSFSWSG